MFKKVFVVVISFLVLSQFPAFAQQTQTQPSEALPADGGAPGKVYMDYTKLFAAGDIEGIKKLVTAERAKQLDDPELKQMLPLMRSMQPKDIKITGGTKTATDATLNVTGTESEGGGPRQGTVHLVLENNQWKIEKESWKSVD
jgi:hypothetical protein